MQIFLICALVAILAACIITAGPSVRGHNYASSEISKLETQRIANVLADNEWGQVLRCRLNDGLVRFVSGFKAFDADRFPIVIGERRELDLFSVSSGERESLWLSFEQDGETLTACRHGFRVRGPSCDRFEIRIDRHEPAVVDTLDIFDFIEGARLTCRFPTLRAGQRSKPQNSKPQERLIYRQ